MAKTKVYLDNCTYNRPFDDQKDIAVLQCGLNDAILKKALELESFNFRSKDALHIAAAIHSQCDYFITTDKKILNKKVDGIIMVNPLVFVKEYLE